jgi:dethiobiotin synthetase
MKGGYFITGNDTSVGKTMVTAALATGLRRQGFKVGVMKPAETGCKEENGRLLPQDALFLRAASACSAPLELITPYAFAEPLAPAIAAERAGVTIDINHIRRCYHKLLAGHDLVLVEGAGGLLVPLTGELTMLDMAVALNLPLFIVARNVLGVINHTTLTVSVAGQRSVVLGVILNHTAPPDPDDLALQTNEQALQRWSGASLYCTLPYVSKLAAGALESLGEMLLTDRLLESMGIGAMDINREEKDEVSIAGR